DGRTNTKREQEGARGYATGFEGLVGYIKNLLPENEVIGEALRRSVPMYPELAIRELAANVIIHQDLAVTGAGPMIEIFDSRIEITNPGEPLVEPNRFLDLPPRSRNEALASFMRRIGVCEERGSGIDKVISQVEAYQLPAPLFETPPGSTRATLFAHRSFSDMSMDDRMRASYQHACLQYVTKRQMTNSSLRERFGIEERNSSQVSRVIRDSVDRGLIKRADPESGSRKHANYVPYWV
ncbi:MAG TPA: ATP-binding protein, partial [Phycisphaerae bacterium]|nr:ATP-binding protein [Phycisphaerae bacterium]